MKINRDMDNNSLKKQVNKREEKRQQKVTTSLQKINASNSGLIAKNRVILDDDEIMQ